MHRVVITGVGVVSCLGVDLDAVTEALKTGRSGIVYDPERAAMGFKSPLTGTITGFDESALLSKKERKTMPDFGLWAYKAAKDALGMAGLDAQSLKNEETGLVFGCDSSAAAAVEQTDLLREHRDSARIGSGLIFRSMTSTITLNLNTIFQTQGACWTISSACSSGGHAVGQAADLIALGRQERVICGAAQEITPESMCSFDALGAFSKRLDHPAKASRPFDKDRDGLIPSGGAAAIILERRDLALKRGAPILGEIRAYAFSSDGRHLTTPSPDGLARSMSKALKAAELSPGDVDYLCAHATSTPSGDAAEAANIKAVFEEKTPDVSSLKSMTGHELWMSGASQLVYCALMARGGFIAPNVNFTEPDPACAGLNIVRKTIHRPPRLALLNAAGFGGTNSCLVVDFSDAG